MCTVTSDTCGAGAALAGVVLKRAARLKGAVLKLVLGAAGEQGPAALRARRSARAAIFLGCVPSAAARRCKTKESRCPPLGARSKTRPRQSSRETSRVCRYASSKAACARRRCCYLIHCLPAVVWPLITQQTRAGNGAPPRDLARELSSLHRGGPPGGRAAAAQKQVYLQAAKK